MGHVFISHAEEDGAVALGLAALLREQGFATWCYERDSLPGPSYLAQVAEAIVGASAVIVILSRHALESLHVENEAVRAYEERKPFLPLLYGVTHAEFQRLHPTLRQVLGASASLEIPQDGVAAIVPRIVAGLRNLVPGKGPSLEERRTAAESGRERVAGSLGGTVAQFFQGRASELSLLRRYLASDSLRLLLVCGRGGAGKTALVTKFLNDLRDQEFLRTETGDREIGGIVYVSLRQSEFRSPDKIVELICRVVEPDAARELEHRWQGFSTIGEKLEFLFRRTLRGQLFLIALDNFEAVLDDENHIRQEHSDLQQFVETCLEYDHGARLLATSRRTVVFDPEIEGRIGRRRVELSLDEGLREQDAVGLLRDLDVDDALGIRGAPEETLRTVARMCYCIPRTLEVLVGTLRQKRTLRLPGLLARADLCARIVEDPARELYQSLSPDERTVVQVLATYDLPVPAEAVTSVLPHLSVDDILDALVRNYVVTFDCDRFSLHPLDQQYACRQSASEEDGCRLKAFHEAAAEYFRRLRKPPAEWRGIEDLDPQIQEFRHLVSADRFEDACGLLNEIDREHLALWGYQRTVVEMRSALLGRIGRRELVGANLGNLGCAYVESGQAQTGMEYYREALAIARELNNRADEGRWIGNLGSTYIASGDLASAREHIEQALSIAREVGDRKHQGRWLGKLAGLFQREGKPREAVSSYREALVATQEVGDRRFERYWLQELGDLLCEQRELHEAAACLEAAVDVAERIGDRRGKFQCLHKLAVCREQLGDDAGQVHCLRMAADTAGTIGDRAAEGNSLAKLADVLFGRGEVDEGMALYEKVVDIAREVGDRTSNIAFLQKLAELSIAIGKAESAFPYYEKALSVARETGEKQVENGLLVDLGATAYYVGDPNRAIRYYEEALAIARETGNRDQEAVALFDIGDASHWAGALADAERCYEASLALDVRTTSYKCALGLGILGLQQGKVERAREMFGRCIDLCRQLMAEAPSHVHVYTLAFAQLGLGCQEEGIASLREAVAIDSSRKALGYALQDLDVLRRATGSTPGMAEAELILKEAADAAASHGAKNREG